MGKFVFNYKKANMFGNRCGIAYDGCAELIRVAMLVLIRLSYRTAGKLLDYIYLRGNSLANQFCNRLKILPAKSILFAREIACSMYVQAAKSTALRRSRGKKVDSVLHVSVISSKPYMLSRLLRKHNIKSDFLALNTGVSTILQLGYDFDIPYQIQPIVRSIVESYYFFSVLIKYDVIHIHFNSPMSLDSGWELPYLKKLGKILVFHFRGCDIRQLGVNLKKNPDLNCCQECDYPPNSCNTPYQQARIAMASKYGDLFFVTTPDLKDFFDGAEHIPFIAPVGIDFDSIVPVPRDPGVFRVVTSSNHPGVDGVPHLRAAVDRLRAEGLAVELVEVFKTPYREALAIYKSADLYAGKLLMGYYNNANIETMLMGIPNMCFIREEFRAAVPDCPIIVTRPERIYEDLKEAVLNPARLKQIGALGPAFINKYHNPDVIIQHMIDRYNAVWAQRS